MQITEQIKTKLKTAEAEHDVKILFAIESGSRAWGFASTDSDYDVRFVYIHKRDWYLSIHPGRDVIEYPIVDEIDINGWDLRKALVLFQKSNPPLLEWLRSPLVYMEQSDLRQELLALERQNFSQKSVCYHYLHMAQGNYRDYLKGENVKKKKYFYVLRPTFACLWLLKHHTFPPMEFDTLFSDLVEQNSELAAKINKLLEEKRSGVEMGECPRIDIINDYIEASLENIEQAVDSMGEAKIANSVLDDIFRKHLSLLR